MTPGQSMMRGYIGLLVIAIVVIILSAWAIIAVIN